jgi:hypothetical protein
MAVATWRAASAEDVRMERSGSRRREPGTSVEIVAAVVPLMPSTTALARFRAAAVP